MGRTRHAPLLLCLCLAAASSLSVASPEADIKAAFIYNFAKFVEWPLSAYRDSPSLELCTLRDGALEGKLAELSGRLVQGRTLRVRNLDRLEDWAGCHILFLGNSDVVRQPQWLKTLNRAPVLTVSDAPGFAEQGGMIGLFVEADRVRFAVNLGAAHRGGLKLSVHMLQLARLVPQEEQ